MARKVTISLPEELIARAKAYAAAHGTSMTSIVRKHLETLTMETGVPGTAGPLLAYSQGRLPRDEAVRLLGLRDYAELLVALGDADLPMPLPPPREIERQAEIFQGLWKLS